MYVFHNLLETIFKYFIVQDQEYIFEKEFKLIFQNKQDIYNGPKVKLKLSQNRIPNFHKPRPILFAFNEQVEKGLRRVEKKGVIGKIVPIKLGYTSGTYFETK